MKINSVINRIWKKLTISALLLLIAVVAFTTGNESRTALVYPPFKHTWGVVRATPAKLFMLVGNRAKFAEPMGLACVRLESWVDPKVTGADDEVVVYGINSNQNMVIYNKSMFELGIYGEHETGNAQLNHPWGVAANGLGQVYVTDTGNNRVVKMFNPKSDLHYVSSWGTQGSEFGQFNQPRGVAFDNYGNVYVADFLNNRVQIFNADGKYLRSIFGLFGPVAVAAMDANERWSYSYGPSREEFLIVVDSLDSRVSKYSLDGKLLKRVLASDWGVTSAQMQFVAIDYFSQSLLTDRKNNCIWKLDRDLNLLCRFGQKGSADYQFDDPRGITLYRRFGQIFVAEHEGAQYYWVGVDFMNPVANWDAKTRMMTITGNLSETAFVDIDLLDASDKLVTRIAMARGFAGPFKFEWDGTVRSFPKNGLADAEQNQASRLQVGNPVPSGEYKIKISSKATYSSIKDFEQVQSLPVTL